MHGDSGGKMSLWAALWRSENRLDGKRSYLIYLDGYPVLFKTRKEAREYIKREYGYIQSRPDLRSEPHGWKMPISVRVKIILEGK